MRCELRVTTGSHTGRRMWVRDGQTIQIGRTEYADLCIADDPLMSRVHFALDSDGGQLRIRDLGSRNGTFLNGQLVKIQELNHGDQIVAGQTWFDVQIDQNAQQDPRASVVGGVPATAAPDPQAPNQQNPAAPGQPSDYPVTNPAQLGAGQLAPQNLGSPAAYPNQPGNQPPANQGQPMQSWSQVPPASQPPGAPSANQPQDGGHFLEERTIGPVPQQGNYPPAYPPGYGQAAPEQPSVPPPGNPHPNPPQPGSPQQPGAHYPQQPQSGAPQTPAPQAPANAYPTNMAGQNAVPQNTGLPNALSPNSPLANQPPNSPLVPDRHQQAPGSPGPGVPAAGMSGAGIPGAGTPVPGNPSNEPMSPGGPRVPGQPSNLLNPGHPGDGDSGFGHQTPGTPLSQNPLGGYQNEVGSGNVPAHGMGQPADPGANQVDHPGNPDQPGSSNPLAATMLPPGMNDLAAAAPGSMAPPESSPPPRNPEPNLPDGVNPIQPPNNDSNPMNPAAGFPAQPEVNSPAGNPIQGAQYDPSTASEGHSNPEAPTGNAPSAEGGNPVAPLGSPLDSFSSPILMGVDQPEQSDSGYSDSGYSNSGVSDSEYPGAVSPIGPVGEAEPELTPPTPGISEPPAGNPDTNATFVGSPPTSPEQGGTSNQQPSQVQPEPFDPRGSGFFGGQTAPEAPERSLRSFSAEANDRDAGQELPRSGASEDQGDRRPENPDVVDATIVEQKQNEPSGSGEPRGNVSAADPRATINQAGNPAYQTALFDQSMEESTMAYASFSSVFANVGFSEHRSAEGLPFFNAFGPESEPDAIGKSLIERNHVYLLVNVDRLSAESRRLVESMPAGKEDRDVAASLLLLSKTDPVDLQRLIKDGWSHDPESMLLIVSRAARAPVREAIAKNAIEFANSNSLAIRLENSPVDEIAPFFGDFEAIMFATGNAEQKWKLFLNPNGSHDWMSLGMPCPPSKHRPKSS